MRATLQDGSNIANNCVGFTRNVSRRIQFRDYSLFLAIFAAIALVKNSKTGSREAKKWLISALCLLCVAQRLRLVRQALKLSHFFEDGANLLRKLRLASLLLKLILFESHTPEFLRKNHFVISSTGITVAETIMMVTHSNEERAWV